MKEDEGRFKKDKKQERYLEKKVYFKKRRVHDHDHHHDLSLRELEQLRRT
jgi:hypothetical protein